MKTYPLSIAALLAAVALSSASPAGAQLVVQVATANSSDTAKAAAKFLGDGTGDQDEISAAIRSLPDVGGTVLLAEGTYDIRRVEGKLGGIIVDRNNVVLAGQGAATKLVQAPDQDTNVIRIIGSGIGNVTIRDLYVDANRDHNDKGKGDPNVSHARFEFCGIKAYYQAPGGPGGEPNHDVTVRNCHVLNAHSLGIMLEGYNMRVLDNVLGNATSDSVEILTGPGEIRGNYMEITGQCGVGFGSDRADSIVMADNILRVKETGSLEIGFRSWAGSKRHVIAHNVLVVDKGGRCGLAMDIRGTHAAITGNSVDASALPAPLPLAITGGNTIATGNVFENVVVRIDDQTGLDKPVLVENNILDNSTVELKKGRRIGPSATPSPAQP